MPCYTGEVQGVFEITPFLFPVYLKVAALNNICIPEYALSSHDLPSRLHANALDPKLLRVSMYLLLSAWIFFWDTFLDSESQLDAPQSLKP